MHARAFRCAASPATMRAAETARAGSPTSGSSAVAPAANTAARAVSTRTCMSAARCLIAWNEASGRSNCSRFFA